MAFNSSVLDQSEYSVNDSSNSVRRASISFSSDCRFPMLSDVEAEGPGSFAFTDDAHSVRVLVGVFVALPELGP